MNYIRGGLGAHATQLLDVHTAGGGHGRLETEDHHQVENRILPVLFKTP